MAKSKITLGEVMEELKAIKKLVLKDLQIDIEDIKLDKKGLRFNRKPLEDTKKIFDNIKEWSMHIWNKCEQKEAISKETEFTYDCKLLQKPCKFGQCPLNIRRQ